MQSPQRPTRLDYSESMTASSKGRLQSPQRPVSLKGTEFEFQKTQRAPLRDYHRDPNMSPVRVGNLMRRFQKNQTPITSPSLPITSPSLPITVGPIMTPFNPYGDDEETDETRPHGSDFAYSSDSFSGDDRGDELIRGFFSPPSAPTDTPHAEGISLSEMQILNELGHQIHNNSLQSDFNAETLLSNAQMTSIGNPLGRQPDSSEELNSQGETADGSMPFAAIGSVPIWLAQSLEMHGFVEANALQRECFTALAENKKVLSCSGRRSGRAIALVSTSLANLDCSLQAVQILISTNSVAVGKGITRLLRDVLRRSVQQNLSEDMWEHIVVNLEDGKLSTNVDKLRRNGSIGMPVSLVVVGSPKLLSDLIARNQFSISHLRYFGVHWSEKNATQIDAQSLLDVEQYFPANQIKIVMCSDAPQPQLQEAAHQLSGDLQIVNLKSNPSRNIPLGIASSDRKAQQLHVSINETYKLEFTESTAEYIEPDGHKANKIIIICNSKRKSELVSRNLQVSKVGRGQTGVVHHGLPEQLCSKAIRCFNNNTFRILVTTDPYLEIIYNSVRVRPRIVVGFDFPESALIHVNRTRIVTNLMDGYVISLCTDEDASSFKTGLSADPVYVAAVLADRNRESDSKKGLSLPAQAMSLASPRYRRLLRKELQQHSADPKETPRQDKWMGTLENPKVEKKASSHAAAAKLVSPPHGSFKTTSRWEPPAKGWGVPSAKRKPTAEVTKVPVDTKRWMPPPIKKTVAREPNPYLRKDGQLVASGYPQQKHTRRPVVKQTVVSHSVEHKQPQPPPITSPPETFNENNTTTAISISDSSRTATESSSSNTAAQVATSETVKLKDLMGAPPVVPRPFIDDKSDACSTTSEAVPPSVQLLTNRRSSQLSATSSSRSNISAQQSTSAIPAFHVDAPSVSSRRSSVAPSFDQFNDYLNPHPEEDVVVSEPSPKSSSAASSDTGRKTEGSGDALVSQQSSGQLSDLPLHEQESRLARIEAAAVHKSTSSNSITGSAFSSRRTSSHVSDSHSMPSSRRSSDLGIRVEEELIDASVSHLEVQSAERTSRSPSDSYYSSIGRSSLKSDSPTAASSLASSRRTSESRPQQEEEIDEAYGSRKTSPSASRGSSLQNEGQPAGESRSSSLRVSFRVVSPDQILEEVRQESESTEQQQEPFSSEDQERRILQTVNSVDNLFVSQTLQLNSEGENTSSVESNKSSTNGDKTPPQKNEKTEPPSDESRSSLAATLPVDQHNINETYSTVPDVPFDMTTSTHDPTDPIRDEASDVISHSETQSTVDTEIDDEEEMLMQLFIFADNDCDGILSYKELNLLLRHTTNDVITESQYEDLLRDLNSTGLTIEGLRTCLVESSPGGIAGVYESYRQSKANTKLERAISNLTSMRSLRTSITMSTIDLNGSKRFTIDNIDEISSTIGSNS